MKRLILLAPLGALVAGCASVGVDDISRAVGKPVEVRYTKTSEGYIVHGGRVTVVLHPGWKWEPNLYHMGAIAALAADASGKERSEVADALGLPEWAVDYDPADNKRTATRDMARTENSLGSCPGTTTPGWPTHYYRRAQ